MKKLLSILSFLFCFVTAFSQLPTVVEVGQDSFRIKRGEFVLRNQTKDVLGVLVNIGGGVTKFKEFRITNDSTLIFDGDTLIFNNVSVTGGTDTVVNVGLGAAIYKGKDGREFQMKTLVSDTSIVFTSFDDSLRLQVDPGVFSTVTRLLDSIAALRNDFPAAGGISEVTGENGITVLDFTRVRWGGLLDDETYIKSDNASKGIHFIIGDTTLAGIASVTDFYGTSGLWQVQSAPSLYANIALSSIQAALTANASNGMDGAFIHVGEDGAIEGRVGIYGSQGIYLRELIDSTQSYVVGINPTNWKITYMTAPLGGGGGGDGTLLGINGLQRIGDSMYLGGNSLIQNTTIDQGGFSMNWSGSLAGNLFNVTNTNNSTSTAISATAGTVGTALRGLGGQYGVQGTTNNGGIGVSGNGGTTGVGVQAVATVLPLKVQRTSAITNTSGQLAELTHFTSGTPVANFGAHLQLYLQTDGGGSAGFGAGRFGAAWSDPLHANRTSRLEFYNTNATVERRVMAISGPGQLTVDRYGIGLFPGTPVFSLGVLSDGRVVEYTPSTGGTGGIAAVTGSNGLIATTTSNVELGTNPLLHNTSIPTSTFSLSLSGAFSGNLFNVTNTNTTGAAINATGGTSGTGVQGTGGIIGVQGTSTSGIGGDFASTNSYGLRSTSDFVAATFVRNSTATTGVIPNITLQGFTSNTASAGFGQSINLDLETSTGVLANANSIVSRWQVATHLSRVSTFQITGVNNAVSATLFSLLGNGQLALNKYGTGLFPGTASKIAAWDINGNFIEVDPGSFGVGGTGATLSQIDSAVQGNTIFDAAQFNDADDGVTAITLNTSYVALQTDVTHLNARIDSLLNELPIGGGGCLSISNVGGAHEIALITSDVQLKSLIAGAGVTITETDSTITVSAAGAGSETNTLAFTLTTTGNRTIAADNIVQYVLVKPTSTLAGLKIGTVSDDDFYLTATPVTGAAWATFNLGEYLAAGTTFYFSGISSSTDIKIVYKPLHE